jgi:hypothetical protein
MGASRQEAGAKNPSQKPGPFGTKKAVGATRIPRGQMFIDDLIHPASHVNSLHRRLQSFPGVLPSLRFHLQAFTGRRFSLPVVETEKFICPQKQSCRDV